MAEFSKHPFQLSVKEVSDVLQTSQESGLSSSQANDNKTKYGENKLEGEGGVKWYAVLLKQVSNAMILVRIPYHIHS